MSLLGYSKIIELLTGIKNYELDNAIILLSKYKFSELRRRCLIKLAELEKSTIPTILKELNENQTGGTYITINKFFEELKKNNILEIETVGRRTYWKFSPTGETFRKYLLLS